MEIRLLRLHWKRCVLFSCLAAMEALSVKQAVANDRMRTPTLTSATFHEPLRKRFSELMIKGTVTDMDGVAIPGATIIVKGTTIGTSADAKGNYSLLVPDGNGTLVVSFIGFTTEEIPIENRAEINVSMFVDIQTLVGIVVVGYGEVKKSDITGSVASVSLKEIERTHPTSINQGLQGRIAGVMVSKNDGAPGAGINIQIRGVNSFSSTTDPLYVIDGIPFTTGSTPTSSANVDEEQTINPLSFLNPQDILSIEILKDASASAIYGSRGSNGVVLITTKKGETDNNRVEFTMNRGLSEVSRKINVLNAADYATFQNEAVANQSKYEGSNLWVPYPAGQSFANTNWQDEIFQKAISTDYTLGLSGGNSKTNYYLSGNLVDQTGIIQNSGYNRYGLRTNVSTKLNTWLEVGTNNTFSQSKYQLLKTNSDYSGVLRSALVFRPTAGVYDANTASGLSESFVITNPWVYTNSVKNTVNSTLFSSATYLEATLLKDFKFRQNLGYNYTYNLRDSYYGRNTQEAKQYNGIGGIADNSWASLVSESILTYSKTFAQIHSISAVGATTYQKDNWRGKSISARNFPNDQLGSDDLGAAVEAQKPLTTLGESALVSYLGRVNYGFDGRYLATISFRRDGSSKFATNNKWANFSSFALAWRASEEKFINALNVFSNLKFRLSYGQTGNQAISSYQTLSALVSTGSANNGSLNSGLVDNYYNGPANPNLKWETTSQVNFGVDMGFLADRVNVTVDLYHKKTTDLLQQVLIPLSSGYSTMWANAGNVVNRGLEVTAQATILADSKVKWDANVNIAFNRNKLQGLNADQFAATSFREVEPFFIQRNGQPIGAIYGYVEDGFYDNEAEVVEDLTNSGKTSAAAIKSMVGEIKYKNMDSDPTSIGSSDRVIIGNVNPDYIFGITNNFQYKNVNLSFFMQGVVGNDIVNLNLWDANMLGYESNIPQTVWEGRWTPETAATATYPKATSGNTRKLRLTDRMIEDGSYLRMKNINLGYTFNKPQKYIQSINVYGTVSNLFTITNYSWYDPDVNAYGGRGNGASRGVDMNSYPNSRTYSIGIRCIF